MSAQTPKEIISEIKNHIAAGSMDKAIKRYLDLSQDYLPDMEREALQLSRKFHQCERDKIKKRLSYENAEATISQLADELLNDIDFINKNIEEVEVAPAKEPLSGDPEHVKSLIAEHEANVNTLRALGKVGETVLIAEGLTKTYPSSDFSFKMDKVELRLGEITGLVGENATGKTTFLRMLAGDLARDSGKLKYPLFQKGDRLNWSHIKHQIAYVSQELPFWNESLREGIRYSAAIHGIKGVKVEKDCEYILERLGIPAHVDKSWRELSGGYKLRFSLAKALIWHPKLLILDEPLANLDIKTQEVVLSDLKNISNGIKHPISILLSSQEIHGVEKVADQMLFMREGQLENLGQMEDYGKWREKNLFEIACNLGYLELEEKLQDFEYLGILPSDSGYIISCPIEIEASHLMTHLTKKKVNLQYFRELSQSVKQQFYETDL